MPVGSPMSCAYAAAMSAAEYIKHTINRLEEQNTQNPIDVDINKGE